MGVGTPCKRRREPTVSPEVPAVTKPMEKRPKASKKEEEWVVVPRKKDLRKKKGRKPSNTSVKPRRARPEVVLINPAQGMSYSIILRELKKRVNPDELDATVQGIRETRSKDLLVELKCSTKSRGSFREVIGARGTVRHLIPRIEVEIADLEPTIEAEDVKDAVRSFFDEFFTKRPYSNFQYIRSEYHGLSIFMQYFIKIHEIFLLLWSVFMLLW